jgi:type VI secretion system secreted protein VgrG
MTTELWFESGEDSLSVRHFTVREGLSSLFEAVVTAVSPKGDVDLDSLVGRGAALRLVNGRERVFRGVARSVALVHAEPGGLSTYEIHLAHSLWLLGQRTNHRIFQHRSVPEIAGQILGEWGLAAEWQLDTSAHPRLEYRVQYGESDLAFVSRLLEETGITYRPLAAEGDRPGLALTDSPQHRKPRDGGPVPFIDNAAASLLAEYVTDVRFTQEVSPTRVVLRDFDFRRRLDYELAGTAATEGGDPRLEQHHYIPGAFAADEAAPPANARVTTAAAAQHLARGRAAGRVVTFTTNLLDLFPGVVFAIGDHPHPQLAADKTLLVTDLRLEGGPAGSWKISGRAVPAAQPYHPLRATPKPRIDGVESAVIVGPKGQTIHTDEHARVRVQFHWDRAGRFDEASSCWIRVSQGWAGAGFGLLALPRVGQEVLVAFYGGDPDQPVVVGRVFNGPNPVPYKLPEHATRSTWRSESVPGSEGFNELLFEDARGRELVYLQAERNLEQLVKVDESLSVGHNRTKQVGIDETELIGASQTTTVGLSRTAMIGGVDSTHVGMRHAVTVEQAAGAARLGPTGTEMTDRKITLTTGEATITLEGPNITLDAAASILLNAASEISIHGRANITVMAGASVRIEAQDGEVVVQGGPLVHINPETGGKAADGLLELAVDAPPEVDLDDHLDEVDEHRHFNVDEPHWFQEQTAPGGQWDPLRWGKPFQDFGFFNLGVVGRAAGIPAGVLLRQAGTRHIAEHGPSPEAGDPGNGLWGGRAPFGNDPRSHEWLKKGIAHFDKHYR